MARCPRGVAFAAIGTTVRFEGARWAWCTELFLRGELSRRRVLLTNFLPRTTLLLMVDAFIGPRWRDLYEIALAEGYRFLSFGDAMLLEKS
jgi:S-adenosylmethionine:tRNA-ribosyltransferase-isomerase (queuine synthetase)